MNLKLSQQGVILVGVPVGLMLVFLIFLLQLFLRLEGQASESDHSKTIIALANSLVKEYYDAASQLIMMKHISDPEERAKATQHFEAQIEKTEKSYLGLEKLVKSDPEDLKIVLKLEKIAQTGITLMKRYEDHILGKERLDELQVGILYKELDLTGEKFTYWLDQLVNRETKKNRINSREEQGTRLFVKLVIVFGVAAALAIGCALLVLFTRSTTNRLAMLMDNTLRLTKKEPLLPMVQGNDEISQLDLFFHNMAEQLAEATRKERAILDNAVDVICSINNDGCFSAVNPASKTVWGYEPEELIGMQYSQLIAEPDLKAFAETIEQTRAGKALLNTENRIIAKDKKDLHMLWSVRWSEAEKSLFCVAHDITDRKELEKLKQEFVAMVSHELRTPLTSIDMTLSLFLDGCYGELAPVAKQRLKGATVGITRLVLLIDDLLDMEKMEAGKLSMHLAETNLSELVEGSIEAVQGFAELQGVRLVQENNSGEVRVFADPKRIVQVIVNLLSNAIKFSNNDSQVSIRTLDEGEYLELQVIDHGAGVPAGYEETIFGKYEQAHIPKSQRTRGTGLGLPICKAIVEQHGGSIGVKTTEGGGSTFWFRLPGKSAGADSPGAESTQSAC